MPSWEATGHSPLESFLRDYVDQSGGVWDEVEPQVYDVLLPPDPADSHVDAGGRDVLRVTFDPDALPEHPRAQLAGFGTPLVDHLLSVAATQGRFARAYLGGLNLAPHGLPDRIGRGLKWPEGMTFQLTGARALFFPTAVFWFEATFVSDQKEHEILPVGFDLHYARQVRHLERFLESEHLGDHPELFLPEVKHATPAEIFPLARQQVTRTLVPLCNARSRELNERLERQVARMQRYYRDMRSELDQQQHRAQQRGSDLDKYVQRRESLEREQRLRVTELRQKSTLHVQLRLAHLLVIRQPKLRVQAHLVSDRPAAVHPLELVWDPFLESLEAVPCPGCQTPTYRLVADRFRRLACPQCVNQATSQRHPVRQAGAKHR